MQDNLEFLQWTKRYWDQYFPGHEYDAVARRKASGAPSTTAPVASSGRLSSGGAARKPATTPTARAAPRAVGTTGSGASTALRQENESLKEAISGLERERDFYFSKLRDIELLLQGAMEENPELEQDEESLPKKIQAILYSTEEGFEIPVEAEFENGAEEPETF